MPYRPFGPLGSPGRLPDIIDSGTTAPVEHHAPGITDVLKAVAPASPLMAFGPGGMAIAAAYGAAQLYYAKNLQALAEVRDRALMLAPAAITEETGLNDIGKLIESLLHGLLSALLGLAGTTALGGLIGGVIGFFFGGVGAAPGAVAGAKVGFDLGLAALTWLGVGFLAHSIATGFGELVALETSAVRRGWAAGDMPGPARAAEIEAAARELARAAGVLIRLILEGILLYLMRGAPMATTRAAAGTIRQMGTAGSQAVAAETVAALVAQLRRSRLGKGFGDWVELNWQKLMENPKLRPQPATATSATGASTAETPSQARRAAEGKKAEPVEERAPAKTKAPLPAAQEIRELPQYKRMSKTQIEKSLAEQGYTRVPSKDGTGSVWTKAGSDGNTTAVRLDEAVLNKKGGLKGHADEVPHLHKELVPTDKVVNGNYPPNAALKCDDFGNVVTGTMEQPGVAQRTHIPIGTE